MRGPCGRPERLAAPFSARGHMFQATRSLAPNHTARVLLGFNRGPSHGDRAWLWVFSFNTRRRARKTQEQSADGRPLGVQPLAAEIGDRCTRAGPPREALGQGSRDAGRPGLSDRVAVTQTHVEHTLPQPCPAHAPLRTGPEEWQLTLHHLCGLWSLEDRDCLHSPSFHELFCDLPKLQVNILRNPI